MIIISNHGWLTHIAASGVLILVGAIAFWLTRSRGWKAWPLLLCNALLVTALGYAATLIALYYIDLTYGLAVGFVVHVKGLVLILLVPTMVGATVGSALRRHPANGN